MMIVNNLSLQVIQLITFRVYSNVFLRWNKKVSKYEMKKLLER